jgi:hypothetical protein
MTLKTQVDHIGECVCCLERWVESHEYKSYEPFDGLTSYLRPLTFKNVFAERLLQQLIRQSPINLRPVCGVKPLESTKGRGYMAWGYLKQYQRTKNEHYLQKADSCLEWLLKNKSHKFEKPSWGNHFDFTSRAGRLPRHEPIIVWTSLIGQTYLDAYEITKRKNYLTTAMEICSWITDLPREHTSSGDCISYVAFTQSSIHNSNMLGAAILARASQYSGDKKLKSIAKSAMEYSCSRQRSDGSWYYGEGEQTHWIDNFHTGYNLDSLLCYITSSGDKEYEPNLRNGFNFFKSNFFHENGAPKYYHNRTYPIDIQCASQAIDTFAKFNNFDPESIDMGKKTAQWTIDNMFDKKGYFHYRKLPMINVNIPMLHWGQATMYKALSNILNEISKKS